MTSPSRPPVVTVFGGARVERDSALYRQAYELWRLLGRAGCIVCTGGYSGTMGAASRGRGAQAGGRSG